MTVSFELSDQYEMLIKDIAKQHCVSVSDFIRNAVIDRIEEELDIQIYQIAMEELKNDPTTYSMEEAKAIIEL